MKLFRFSTLLFALPFFLLASCSKDNNSTPVTNDGSTYFPLQKGHFVEYHVDSTYWDDFLQLETVHTLDMRYAVADTFTDNAGRLSYTITVSKRKDSTELWQPESVFYITKTTDRLEWIQDNKRFVKLVFPVEGGRQWDGNEFVSTVDQENTFYRDWKYTYAGVGQSYSNGFKTFDNALTVNQINDSLNNPELSPNSFAFRTYSMEKYAAGVGLVEKRFIRWTYDPGVAAARKGTAVVMKAFNNN